MSKVSKLSKLMMGVASLTLSAGVWAGSSMDPVMDPLNDLWDGTTHVVTMPLGDWRMDPMNEPDYRIVDQADHVRYLDRVEGGHAVSAEGNKMYSDDCLKGEVLTDLKTNRSGMITGVKNQGTMEVTTDEGNTVRYQYVNFKVAPVK